MSNQDYKTESEKAEEILANEYFPRWGTGVALVIFVAAVAYKIITSPFNLQIDFTAILSLVLALFAVWLSALFYFKATESSNKFYENTYRHTKDIAQLLTRIESGFGERLRHLDEGYTSMRDRFAQSPMVAVAKKEIKAEEEHIEEKIKEREELVTKLLEKTQLQFAEKQHFMSELAVKDAELKSALLELTRLRADLENTEEIAGTATPEFLRKYLEMSILPRLGSPETLADLPASMIMRLFPKIAPQDSAFFRDMSRVGFTNEERDLTLKGAEYIRLLARQKLTAKPENNE
jgi:hypothetical protein